MCRYVFSLRDNETNSNYFIDFTIVCTFIPYGRPTLALRTPQGPEHKRGTG